MKNALCRKNRYITVFSASQLCISEQTNNTLCLKIIDSVCKCFFLRFRFSKGVKFTLSLCRQPYCSVENRIPRSTAALHSTSSVDSTGSDFGITPVMLQISFLITYNGILTHSTCKARSRSRMLLISSQCVDGHYHVGKSQRYVVANTVQQQAR